MKEFINDDFMLKNSAAKKLYNDYAAKMPIFDYHCHLSPREMYEDKPFESITQVFLDGDHYKWRYMRSMGIDERYMTGHRTGDRPTDFERFDAFCSALQYAVGNPLYHWTHLELKRYFGIDTVCKKETAREIFDEANAVIKEKNMCPSYLINSSNVAYICTTDDPADTLEWHKKIAEKGHINARVLPAFRPDFALNIENDTFIGYVKRLSQAAGTDINTYDDLVSALYKRADFFHKAGCRVSDHALADVPYSASADAGGVFKKVMAGETLTKTETRSYKTALLCDLAKKYTELDWAMQLHIGALRNNNTKMFKLLGADTGFDSIADYAIAEDLSRLLNAMAQNDALPKTILYTLNPKDNYVLGTMLGNFQDAGAGGKIQFGSAWWFCDQRDGMEEQMRALANLGALNKFVGMLTDSRSFLSYTRHEYFRRILCNLIGKWVEDGEFPEDYETLGKIVEDICFNNAKTYFGM
ncbi:MAG: glucuronate isomerase [Firmicutes bacterium]|nr:glucuronate isomerase [Bacillota bacterium]